MIRKLDKSEQKKVRLIVYGEFIKISPLELIKILDQKEKELTQVSKPFSKEAAKIIQKKVKI